MNDQLNPRQARLVAEAERASADAWSAWTSDIGQRLAEVEMRLVVLLGDKSGELPGGGDPALFEVIASFVADERKDRAAAIAKLADAWVERLEAEIATLDERLGEKLDAKIFDIGTLRTFKAKLEKATRELEADMVENMRFTDTKVAALNDEVAALNKRRDVHAVSVRLAMLERALPRPTPTIKSWRLDVANYRAVPTMSTGELGAPLDLRPMFEAYFAETAD